MEKQQRGKTRAVVETLITFTPWLISMYTLYCLEYAELWTTETPHRGKTSVAILIIGMLSSFFVYSHFATKRNRQNVEPFAILPPISRARIDC